MSSFAIFELALGAGRIALCPAPGGQGDYLADVQNILDWGPAVVCSLTAQAELDACGAGDFGARLAQNGIPWLHLPVPDFGVPEQMNWADQSAQLLKPLDQGQRVLVHCKGGCGRSGMLVLRIMIAAGEDPDAALARLREIRPCAVETDAQLAWAYQG
ncbi:protein phosphatase [Loktanella sp. D2R18]|uniref:protein-tyrosine phosphatase family protein n=1 Tax=Rhodobacterales TaxID=204455 RepID=UPI000DEADD50|nr:MULTISPECIES: protein-tyrosine phosphatase family protein [Rhodobacterales]MDO6588884.1 protein-tyrosine phosphatase family protein [Yoonia sp. 1_MG-2023]RBW41893.1 protein phosphatase [Loktanella sp. D2R18]